MLHDSAFSLYEAMSAVEIGDPKLDAGMAQGSKPQCVPTYGPHAKRHCMHALYHAVPHWYWQLRTLSRKAELFV